MRLFKSSALSLASGASLLAAWAIAGSLEVSKRSTEEVSRAGLVGVSLSKTHRVIPFADGSRFVIHHELNTWEQNAIGATLIRPDGKGRVFWAENFVRPGTVPEADRPAPRTVGQIYGAALFPDGDTMAVSIGWADAQGRSHNAIGITSLKRQGGGNLIEFEGTVRDLAAGPGNLLLAVTYVPARGSEKGGAPLLTILDTYGVVHGESFPLPKSADTRTIGESVHSARLERIDTTRFALYQDLDPSISILELSATPSIAGENPKPRPVGFPVKAKYLEKADAAISVSQVIPLPDPEREASSRARTLTKGFHVENDRSVTVVRSYTEPRPHTTVLRYPTGGSAPKTWSPATPWRAAYWTGDTLVGVTGQEDVTLLESVKLEQRD